MVRAWSWSTKKLWEGSQADHAASVPIGRRSSFLWWRDILFHWRVVDQQKAWVSWFFNPCATQWLCDSRRTSSRPLFTPVQLQSEGKVTTKTPEEVELCACTQRSQCLR